MSPDEKEAWATAVEGIDELGMLPSVEPVCETIAVIDQESSFRENPVVPNLAKIVEDGLARYTARLGPLGPPVVTKVLGAKAPGATLTFAERLERARTERDVDRVFRDLVTYYEDRYPRTTKVADLVTDAVMDRHLSDFNPITTAGSMQVSVHFALARASAHEDVDEGAVREELYTRNGGVRFGTARLLGYEAAYDAPLYRFADYNAGIYASRNAAVQEQLSELTGMKLALDGDLLVYDADGTPSKKDSQTLAAFLAFAKRHAPDLDERRIRKDLLLEKTIDFESTETYRALRKVYRALTGKVPAYARVPDVDLESPKLTRRLTTAWFARSVARRYEDCVSRAPRPQRSTPD
ncbi:MAG: DUF1615 family protein [Acidobacteriota bacterium]